MNIAIGADHGGVDLKHAIVARLQGAGHTIQDFGTNNTDSVDYPDFSSKVARGVVSGRYDRGILVCKSGVGMCMAVNRYRGIQGANVRSVEETITTRQHNDANVLCLGAGLLETDEALAMVDAFLETDFEGGRHEARVIKASGSRLAITDPELYEVICAEENRQNLNIELIASENFTSGAVMEAQGSLLTNKYAEVILVADGMVVVSMLMWPSSWPLIAPRKYSVLIMPMCNLTQDLRPIRLSISPS